jgi:hypothetical protein
VFDENDAVVVGVGSHRGSVIGKEGINEASGVKCAVVEGGVK